MEITTLLIKKSVKCNNLKKMINRQLMMCMNALTCVIYVIVWYLLVNDKYYDVCKICYWIKLPIWYYTFILNVLNNENVFKMIFVRMFLKILTILTFVIWNKPTFMYFECFDIIKMISDCITKHESSFQ